MKIIKSNSYNVINTEPFDIHLPCEFELWWANTILAQYRISEDGVVDYSFNPDTDRKMLTSTKRPLMMGDIYYLFSSRVFPDKMHLTQIEMDRFGIAEYNPFVIIQKTHGMFLVDKYWFRFSDQELTYKTALADYLGYFERSYQNYLETVKRQQEEYNSLGDGIGASTRSNIEPDKVEQLDSIINQHTLDFSKVAGNVSGEPMTAEEFHESFMGDAPYQTVKNEELKNPLSEDDISGIFSTLDDITASIDEKSAQIEDSGSNLSEDAISAMLAAAGVGEGSETVGPSPETDPNSKMSEDAISAMLAANGT
ncbi:MAG: hypothetical protein LBR74_01470 [Eubacterium sp.]|jgi:hypothetical protein|nr:hypothetical protein [Eubacterium sp.]